MNKEQFMAALRHRLRYLPAEEVERSLSFYAESIDDRVEDGMSEWEAVAALGDVESIAREIETSLPLVTVVKERVKKEKHKTSGGSKWLWVLLIVLGCPIWLSVLAALAVSVLAVYVSLWVAVICVFIAPVVLFVVGLALLLYAIVKGIALGVGAVLLLVGSAAVLVGLALLLFAPLCLLAKGFGKLTVGFGRWVKGLILGKGGHNA